MCDAQMIVIKSVKKCFLTCKKKFKINLSLSLCLFRNVFKVDDIALNYRDHEGDLIRILDDEDVQLMIEESRGQQGKVKRPVNQFPWELHVTLASDLSVYNVEA